jgi:hypothetical protein
MQRSRLAAVDNIRIPLQESFNGGFIRLAQVEFPIAEPFAESGNGTDDGKKPSCSICFRYASR